MEGGTTAGNNIAHPSLRYTNKKILMSALVSKIFDTKKDILQKRGKWSSTLILKPTTNEIEIRGWRAGWGGE